MTDSVKVDLNDFPKASQVHNLVGYELGERARDHLKIADLERSHDTIEVSVPEHIYFLSPAFFNGMFVQSMKRIRTGSEFFDKFRFDCSWNIWEQIVLAAQDFYEDLDDDQKVRKVG